MKRFLCALLASSVLLSAIILSSCGKKSVNSDTAPETDEYGITVAQNNSDETIDLTKMSSTVVYSYVCTILNSPDEYLDKKIIMSGICGYYKDESTDTVYYSCNISDTTACCAVGIEFVLMDKNYDEYPKENENITVEGVFETYNEGDNRYGRLKEAKIIK